MILSSRVPKPEIIARLKAAGHKVDYLQADMQEREAPAKLVADATAITGRLDILVNNAGVAQHGETHSFTEDNYRRLMDINVDAVFRACQAALGPMRKQQSGVILNIGSISGYISNIPQPQAPTTPPRLPCTCSPRALPATMRPKASAPTPSLPAISIPT